MLSLALECEIEVLSCINPTVCSTTAKLNILTEIKCLCLLLAFPSQEPLSLNCALSLNIQIIFLGV